MKTLLLALAVPFLAIAAATAAEGPVRHVVHFKFREDATPEQIERVIVEFAALKKTIKVIESFESGINVSPEGLDKGFKHCWILTFRNEKDRDAYLVHPTHKAFAELVKPLLADVFVIDFIPSRTGYVPVDKAKKPMRSGIPRAWGQQKTG